MKNKELFQLLLKQFVENSKVIKKIFYQRVEDNRSSTFENPHYEYAIVATMTMLQELFQMLHDYPISRKDSKSTKNRLENC